jgi:hypothetical protein
MNTASSNPAPAIPRNPIFARFADISPSLFGHKKQDSYQKL